MQTAPGMLLAMTDDKCIPNSLWYGLRLMYKTGFYFL